MHAVPETAIMARRPSDHGRCHFGASTGRPVAWEAGQNV
jgi:hypothetical protein